MNNIRVCHVNLAKGFRGGERQTELLIRHLQPHLAGQILVCRRDSPLKVHLADVANLEIVETGGRLGGHGVSRGADIINAHEAKAAHWALAENLLRKTPFVITRRVPQKIKKGLISGLCYKRASALVGISSPIAGYLREISRRPVVTINSTLAHMNGDAEKTAAIRREYRDKIVIGHIGAYVDRHKGQRVIIDAARFLAGVRDDLVFLLLGAGSDEQELKALSADVPSVRWLGFQNDVGSYIRAFDLFVFPSRNEGLGSTLLDVMDHQVPIIATDVDGIPDIVKDGKTGLLIENGDSRGLAEAILKLIENRNLAASLAANAKSSLAEFQPEAMAAKYLKLYQDILSGQGENR
ncbi:MAG: glycosyltransferase family 4 protein [Succinivibrionaceae bacterium]|nr:glycosyltransferase family 4 protein [Succinivibrionaceae bacterium]